MNKKTKDAYLAGIFGLLVFFILGVFAVSVGFTIGGIVVGGIGTLFGILGAGCFIKPELFSPILNQMMDNIKRSNDAGNNNQKQTNPINSPQFAMRDGNTINNYLGVGGRKKKRN